VYGDAPRNLSRETFFIGRANYESIFFDALPYFELIPRGPTPRGAFIPSFLAASFTSRSGEEGRSSSCLPLAGSARAPRQRVKLGVFGCCLPMKLQFLFVIESRQFEKLLARYTNMSAHTRLRVSPCIAKPKKTHAMFSAGVTKIGS
jgi:hypothetical protein